MNLIQLILAVLFGYAAAVFLRRPSAPERMETYPLCHVSFDPLMSTDERLNFLTEVATAIGDGRLIKAQNLEDHCATNQASKPGADLED